MPLCNVEFFSPQTMQCIWHDEAMMPDIDDDYISITNSSIELSKTTSIQNGSLIRIRGDYDWVGCVSEVDNLDDDKTTVSFKPFISLFDEDCVFDTNTQGGSKSLERLIADMFKSRFVNVDSYQKLPLEFKTTSSTTKWDFALDSSKEESHYTVIGAYSEILVDAMSFYGIAVEPTYDFGNKKITLTIGTHPTKFYIDADMANVKITKFDIHKSPNAINKLVVWNWEDLSVPVIFYLHPDETFDTENKNRITPVVQGEEITEYSGEDKDKLTVDQRLAAAAVQCAINKFSGISWSSLIELECAWNDKLLDPVNLPFGQQVTIYHDGYSYPSILTGKKFSGGTVTLSFGTVRYDLIKKLTRREA